MLNDIINNSAKNITIGKRDWKITALKMGTKWKICEEARTIDENSEGTDGIIVEMSKSIPTVVKCIALVLLNDKERINNELDELCDILTWSDIETNDFLYLFEMIFQMLDMSFFFHITNNLKMLLQETMKIKNQNSSPLVQNGD